MVRIEVLVEVTAGFVAIMVAEVVDTVVAVSVTASGVTSTVVVISDPEVESEAVFVM